MKVSISEATRMVGLKSRSTFYRHIKKKGISLSEDEEGNPRVDISELIRVYGDKVKTPEQLAKAKKDKSNNNDTPNTKQVIHTKTPDIVQIELEVLKERVKTLETERERERNLLENQVNDLKSALDKAQDITLLLEDKRVGQGANKEAELDSKLKKMEDVVEELRKQNERLLKKEEERQKKVDERRKQRETEKAEQAKLEEENEKNKSFFKWMFG